MHQKKTTPPSFLLRKATRADGKSLLALVDALADYEHLPRPRGGARRRLLRDAFRKRNRFDVYLALKGSRAIGYAIFFETYSSFLAQPTFYLEDIFVLAEYRGAGVGRKLFLQCLDEARRRNCGRMEWMVLDWNSPAIDFYTKLGASRLKGWLPFRIEKKNFRKILKHPRKRV